MAPNLSLSNTVQSVRKLLLKSKSTNALNIILAILRRHPEYGGGTSKLKIIDPIHTHGKEEHIDSWLIQIRELFDLKKVNSLFGRIVIIGLCILDESSKEELNQFGFLNSLIQELSEPIESLLTKKGEILYNKLGILPSHSPPTEAIKNPILDIETKTSDRVSSYSDSPEKDLNNDKLGRAAYARFLVQKIFAVTSREAFSMHLGGPWGSGKSTLLNFMKTELKNDPKNQWVVVEFNAWQNQHISPPWWPLLDAIFEQSKSVLRFWAKFKENLWRKTMGKTLVQLGIFLIATIIFLILCYASSNGEPHNTSGTNPTTNEDLVKLVGAIIAAVLGLYSGILGISSIFTSRSSRTAESYIETTTNPMGKIAKKFNNLIERIEEGKISKAKSEQIKLENGRRTKLRKDNNSTNQNIQEHIDIKDLGTRVAVIIDDLDRCKTEYVVELLEGIQTLFRDKNVVFIVAADQRWLHACFEDSYEKLKAHVKETGKGLGTLFLEKVFQFVVPIPAIPDKVSEAYWLDLLQRKKEKSDEDITQLREEAKEKVEQINNESDILMEIDDDKKLSYIEKQLIREEAVVRFAAPEIVDNIENHTLSPFATLLNPNPRAMKRLVNAYSINRALSTLGHLDIPQQKLALWTILSMRWPSLARYLEANPYGINHITEQAEEGMGKLVESGIDPAISKLFRDSDVLKVVNENGLGIELDSEIIELCGMLRM